MVDWNHTQMWTEHVLCFSSHIALRLGWTLKWFLSRSPHFSISGLYHVPAIINKLGRCPTTKNISSLFKRIFKRMIIMYVTKSYRDAGQWWIIDIKKNGKACMCSSFKWIGENLLEIWTMKTLFLVHTDEVFPLLLASRFFPLGCFLPLGLSPPPHYSEINSFLTAFIH